MSKLLEFYHLKSLIRYNTRLKLTSETVAEHSYFVSLFTMIICEEVNLDNDVTANALRYAIIHDIPEIDTSDIPYPVKKANPELSNVLHNLEIKSIKNHLGKDCADFFEIVESNEEGTKELQIIRQVVKLADTLSVKQYCENEMTLGNSAITPIMEDAKSRISTYKENLFKLTGIKVKLGEE